MRVHIIDFSKVSHSKLNPLGLKLRETILDELQRAIADDQICGILLTGGSSRNFSAGADLTEFSSVSSILPSSSERPQISLIDVVDAIEASPKPVVACIEGNCLGGGLELALACHYRVAVARGTKLGLPEVHVGVIPGAGGTQRLPRLVGLQQALQMVLAGASIGAHKALKVGLIDQLVGDQNNVVAEGIKMVSDPAASMESSLQKRRLSHRSVPEDPATCHVICHVASLSIPRLGHSGIQAALEACRGSFTLPYSEGMKREGELFLEVLLSEEGQARRHAFFATRQAQKAVQAPLASHPLLNRNETRIAGVIGGGTMGAGIALVLLKAGFIVHLVDISEKALSKGVSTIEGIVSSQVKRKKIMAEDADKLRARLVPSQSITDLSKCQVVVEAIVEVMKIKRNLFRQLDGILGKECIVLSNTSTLDIDEMASAMGVDRRPLFAGWHYFSPAHVMKLVEVVVGKHTSTETVALLQALTKQVGKIGVVVGNCDGFCGNRLLKPYSSETVLVLTENGMSVKDVDDALLNFGMALGPFQMGDLAGNDIGYNIRRERGWVRQSKSSPIPSKRPSRYTELGDDMVAILGRLGQKANKGWYDYDPSIGKGRKGIGSVEVTRFVQKYTHSNSSMQRLEPEEIVARVLFPLVNEGFKCLEEGIARDPADIDVVYLYGYGWPVFKGGPMYWADHHIGLPTLLAQLRQFQSQFPDTDHYKPARLLEDCVQKGFSVEEYYRRGLQSKL